LALPGGMSRYGAALNTARARLMVKGGFAYSEAGSTLWTEGTAQAALLAALLDRRAQAARLLAAVERNRAPSGSYFAADRDADTGFRLDTDASQARRYFHLPHLGALSWAIMAQQHFNPFIFGHSLPS
jgi:hypothetical protein